MINKHIEKIKALGYTDVRTIETGEPYLIGVRDNERPQWFKVARGKLYRRMDIHAGKFVWEVIE